MQFFYENRTKIKNKSNKFEKMKNSQNPTCELLQKNLKGLEKEKAEDFENLLSGEIETIQQFMWVEHIFKPYKMQASIYLNLDEAFILGLHSFLMSEALLYSFSKCLFGQGMDFYNEYLKIFFQN